jgi:hypothetical protein
MSLLHEGDLFRVIDKLEEEANGTFSLKGCNINPSGATIMETATAANITAQCELEWYTIRLADGRPIDV